MKSLTHQARRVTLILLVALAVTGEASAQVPQALRVVDNAAQVVGPLYTPGVVLLNLNSTLYQVPIYKNGFQNSQNYTFFFTTSDCSGTYYIQAEPTSLAQITQTSDALLYFASQPFQVINAKSWFRWPSSGNGCSTINFSITAGPAAAYDLSTLGFVPPFHLEY